jgi:hypothetical protein
LVLNAAQAAAGLALSVTSTALPPPQALSNNGSSTAAGSATRCAMGVSSERDGMVVSSVDRSCGVEPLAQQRLATAVKASLRKVR